MKYNTSYREILKQVQDDIGETYHICYGRQHPRPREGDPGHQLVPPGDDGVKHTAILRKAATAEAGSASGDPESSSG